MDDSVKKALEDAEAKYKRLVILEIGERVLGFRALDRAKITHTRKQLAKQPDLALDILTNMCKFQCVVGAEHFDEVADAYPLVIAGDDSVADQLMALARGPAVLTIRAS